MIRLNGACLVSLSLFASVTNAEASTPTGVWLDHTGRGAVEIAACGTSLCGQIVWLKDKQHNDLCGTKILGDLRHVGNGTWDYGWIYSPEKGSRFDVEIKILQSGKLRVLGYAGVKFLSETMIWEPAPQNLERCSRSSSEISGSASEPATKSDRKNALDQSAEGPMGASQPHQPQTTDGGRSERVAALPTPLNGDASSSVGIAVQQGSRTPVKRAVPCKLDLPYVRLTFPCLD